MKYIKNTKHTKTLFYDNNEMNSSNSAETSASVAFKRKRQGELGTHLTPLTERQTSGTGGNTLTCTLTTIHNKAFMDNDLR